MGKGLLYETGGRIAMFARYPAHPYFTAGKTVGFHRHAPALLQRECVARCIIDATHTRDGALAACASAPPSRKKALPYATAARCALRAVHRGHAGGALCV